MPAFEAKVNVVVTALPERILPSDLGIAPPSGAVAAPNDAAVITMFCAVAVPLFAICTVSTYDPLFNICSVDVVVSTTVPATGPAAVKLWGAPVIGK